jgi:hypothetical protein
LPLNLHVIKYRRKHTKITVWKAYQIDENPLAEPIPLGQGPVLPADCYPGTSSSLLEDAPSQWGEKAKTLRNKIDLYVKE